MVWGYIILRSVRRNVRGQYEQLQRDHVGKIVYTLGPKGVPTYLLWGPSISCKTKNLSSIKPQKEIELTWDPNHP